MVRTIQELRENAEKRAERIMVYEVRFPASRKGHPDIYSGTDVDKIRAILNEAQGNDEFSSAVAELMRQYESGKSDLFPDPSSYAPIILATRTHPESPAPFWKDQTQEFRLWFDFPSAADYNHVDSSGQGMILSIHSKDYSAIDGLVQKLELPFLDNPKFVLPKNGTEVYARNPIAICRLKEIPTTIGVQRYVIGGAKTDYEHKIQDEKSAYEEVVFRE